MKRLAVILLSFGLAVFSKTGAETESPPADSFPIREILPRPLDPAHFESLRSSSPFRRTLNLSDTYALRGVANIGGEPVATLYNRESKKSVVVTSSAANGDGMQLVEVVPASDLTGVAAKISFSGEEVELSFEPERIAPVPKDAPRQGEAGKDGKRHGGEKRRGPSKQDIERYKALSEKQREQFRAYIRQTMQKYPNLSREERGNMIRGAMTRLSDGGELNLDAKPPSRGK